MTKAEEDLLVLARRGDLGDDESRRLRELLATDDDARELYEVGRALDKEAPVVAGDELMYARIVRNVSSRHRAAHRPPLRRWIARGAIAAILLTGITVGASVVVRYTTTKTPTPSVPPPAPAPPPPPIKHTSATAPAPQVAEEATPPVVTPPVAPPPVAPHVHHVEKAPPVVEETPAPPIETVTPPIEAPPVEQPPPPPPSASELFAAANRARVQGNTTEAIERANELETRYPKSKEAIATHVTLGMLHLKAGDAAAALSSFDAYLSSGNTAVIAEALWGKSQALRALDRSSDERTTLEQLVAGYPHSAYTNAARNRLSTLK